MIGTGASIVVGAVITGVLTTPGRVVTMVTPSGVVGTVTMDAVGGTVVLAVTPVRMWSVRWTRTGRSSSPSRWPGSR